MANNDTLKSKRDEANKIVNEIKEKANLLDNNLQKSKIALLGLDNKSFETKKLNTSLNSIISTTQETINKFRTERDKVSKLLTQVNSFYEKKYIPLQRKIDDEENGFNAKLKQGTQFKNQIIKLTESTKLQYEEVKKYATELKSRYRELITIDSSIRKLLQDSTNKNSKINEINSHVLKLDLQIARTHEKIDKLFNDSKINEKNISDLLMKSNEDYENIKEIKSSSNQFLEDIQNIYEIAAETGLSGEFDKRRSHLKVLLKKWEKHIIFTTLVLLTLIILMFIFQLKLYKWDLTNHTFDINFYVRFLIASPIVYYLYFCSNQYSQTKKLHDKYSFKTTLAMSIQSHIKLLTGHEKFDDKDRINKILEFILDGFQKIYSEPYTEDDYKLKLKLANMEIDIEKRIIETISKTLNIDNLKK